ncbi:MAG TPA: thiamine phosphate synthase [Vicinamibacterales bacterium]|jgi:thiamine-phosphate pyrophosphorylase|nr:thiamine phosphate synthase [Vicinamibacterales bacterium]
MTPVVCLITDRARGAGGADGAVERVRWAARAGVHLVQVRERDLDGGPLTALVRRCVEAVRGSRARVLVNDRLDVALAAGAHGVHLRADSMPAPTVRALCPPGFLVGRSVHARDEAVAVAAAGGLDYLLFGTVFPTFSKPGRPASGVTALVEVAAAVTIPVLAVGGVTPDNVGEVAAAGAAGFAAIGMFAADSEAAFAQSMAAVTSASKAASRP